VSQTVYPDGLDARGKAGLWAVPAIASLAAPKLTELSAGFAVHCAIYNFDPTADQAATEDNRYCTRNGTETPGRARVTISPMVYVYDPQEPDAATGPYAHYGKFVESSKWFLVDRRGLDFEQALAVGQVVDIYPVLAGYRNRVPVVGGEEGSKLRVSQKFFIAQDPVQDSVIVS
jgi:hypothetical protein